MHANTKPSPEVTSQVSAEITATPNSRAAETPQEIPVSWKLAVFRDDLYNVNTADVNNYEDVEDQWLKWNLSRSKLFYLQRKRLPPVSFQELKDKIVSMFDEGSVPYHAKHFQVLSIFELFSVNSQNQKITVPITMLRFSTPGGRVFCALALYTSTNIYTKFLNRFSRMFRVTELYKTIEVGTTQPIYEELFHVPCAAEVTQSFQAKYGTQGRVTKVDRTFTAPRLGVFDKKTLKGCSNNRTNRVLRKELGPIIEGRIQIPDSDFMTGKPMRVAPTHVSVKPVTAIPAETRDPTDNSEKTLPAIPEASDDNDSLIDHPSQYSEKELTELQPYKGIPLSVKQLSDTVKLLLAKVDVLTLGKSQGTLTEAEDLTLRLMSGSVVESWEFDHPSHVDGTHPVIKRQQMNRFTEDAGASFMHLFEGDGSKPIDELRERVDRAQLIRRLRLEDMRLRLEYGVGRDFTKDFNPNAFDEIDTVVSESVPTETHEEQFSV